MFPRLYPLLAVALFASFGISFAYIPSLPTFRSVRHHLPVSALSMATASSTTTTKSPGKTDTGKKDFITPGRGSNTGGAIEWNIDDHSITRNDEDPFHILLLEETFLENERITIEYAASSCSYVLMMPYDEAAEYAAYAKSQGFCCLGTWSRAECLRLGRDLQQRDLIVRIVPFCEGATKPWQARDAGEAGFAGTFGEASDEDAEDFE